MVNINLLPPELKLKRIAAKRDASLVGICIVVILIFIVIGIVSRSVQSTINDYLTNSKAEVDKNNVNLDDYADLQDLALTINDRAKAAAEINNTRVSWSQVLSEIAINTPIDVQISNLNANSSKSPNFILQGNTTQERQIIVFKEKLENSVMFKNVNFKSSSSSSDSGQVKKLEFTLDFDLEQKNLSGSTSQWKQNQL